MRIYLRRALCSALCLYGPLVFAQPTPHFEPCQQQTGSNASIIVPSSASGTVTPEPGLTEPIEPGDEVAVFTPEGLCAGAIVWTDETAVLAVWEDDPETPGKDGFVSGDPLAYRLWDASTEQEIATATATYDALFDTTGTFVPGGVYALTALAFGSGGTVDTEDEDGPALAFAFEPNYPNPFATGTTFRYTIPEPAAVRLEIYDLLGRRVATLVDDDLAPGPYEAQFRPDGLANGAYIGRLTAGSHVATQRIMLVR